MDTLQIEKKYKDNTINVVLDTIKRNKQSLVFVSSKRSAEKVAREIAVKLKHIEDNELEKSLLNALDSPTKQCENLSAAAKRKIVFHHAGLAPKQRQIIEDAFRNNQIHTIVCTPTLAAGLDLPAYRAILRDVKRYTGSWGMQFIPVLEYKQMAGRAGRPGKEDYGEAIIITNSAADAYVLKEKFLEGSVEPVQSKLAVEPVLRMYTLSLIASQVIDDYGSLLTFFDKTLYAHQFGDREYLENIILRVLAKLQQWDMIEKPQSDFQSANEINQPRKLQPTLLGKRVSDLCIDPLSAHEFVKALKKIKQTPSTYATIQLCLSTLEARPLLRMSTKETEAIAEEFLQHQHNLLTEIPSLFDPNYDDFLKSIKTTQAMCDYIDEKPEAYLLEKYAMTPGELKDKQDKLLWLLTALQEIARVLSLHTLITPINKLAIRVEYGVKDDVLAFVHLKGIGRVRARKLSAAGLRTIDDLRKTPLQNLEKIIGKKTAEQVKAVVGDSKIIQGTT